MTDCSTARSVLVDDLGGLSETEAERLRGGDPALVARKLEALEKNRSWLLTLSATMTAFAVVLPTAGLYQFFRAVNSLEPIELIGVIAAACAVAAAQMAVPVYLYMNWRRRVICYRALLALDAAPETEAVGEQDEAPV